MLRIRFEIACTARGRPARLECLREWLEIAARVVPAARIVIVQNAEDHLLQVAAAAVQSLLEKFRHDVRRVAERAAAESGE